MTNTSGKPAKEAKAEKSEKPVSKSPRRRAREFALQGLYQWRVGGNDEAAIEAHLADTTGFDKADREFFVGLLRGVLAQQTELQEQLQVFLDRSLTSFRRSKPASCWPVPSSSSTTRKRRTA